MGAERTRWIAEACGDDEGLRREVEGLLAADEDSVGFLEEPASEAVPERLGPFRVLGLLGRGGMGVVYEAEQDSPQRRVAVKVVRAALFDRSRTARFRYEAELLGRLQHPGIAQVYAAGSEAAEDGERLWIAMELVRGRPLVEHVREHALGVSACLALVARVADAVHHAHQRGIIHRDLKSANVLVDETGDPKVLDFGVARLEGAELRTTMATLPGLIVGTLQTMSPEQASADADVDARTDVYALGAIAYELLAGRPPLQLSELPLPAALRRVLVEEPPRLGALSKRLAGDVEVVVAKALEKDRERRYHSAAALAADLRRLVRGEPVEARPPSTSYLLSKLVRRHVGLTVGAALALVATLGGLVAVAVQAARAARAERDAASEARAAAAIDGYLLQDLLAAPDPRVQGRDVRVVDVLERAAARVGESFAGEPALAARVRATLGKSFLALDQLVPAEESLRAAVAGLRVHAGPDARPTLEAEGALVQLLAAKGDAQALPLARAAVERQRTVLGPDDETTLTTATDLATALLGAGETAEAERVLRDVVARRTRTLGADATQTLLARENLAAVLTTTGRVEEAFAERHDALELRRARYGDRDPGTLLAAQHCALEELYLTPMPDAVARFETLLSGMEEVFGAEHHQTSASRFGLALALDRAGRSDEAIELLERVVELRRARLGPAHDMTFDAEIALVRVLLRVGLAEAAAELAEQALAGRRAQRGGAFALGIALLTAGEARLAAGARDAGSAHLREARGVLAPLEGPAAAAYRDQAERALRSMGASDEE